MSDWFAVITYPYDPTRIEMRRMSEDEIATAKREQALAILKSLDMADLAERAQQFGAAIAHDIAAGLLSGVYHGHVSYRRAARRAHSRKLKRGRR